MEDAGAIPWTLIHAGTIILGIALAIGIWINRKRRLTRAEREAQTDAVKRNIGDEEVH